MFGKLQSAIKKVLGARGYRFESRKFGRGQITLWRRSLRRRRSSERPKRLVIVPGFGDTPMSWLPMATLLPRMKGFRDQEFEEIVILEFSGYLGSLEKQRAIDSVANLILAVTEVVDELTPHTLVGQSLGGFLSAFYASELPARRPESGLERLVLIAPAGLALGGEAQEKWEAMLREMAQGRVDGFIRSALGPVPKLPVLRLPYRLVSDQFSEFLLREESLSILNSFEEGHEMRIRASMIRTPTLLIWGEKDLLIPFRVFPLWEKELERGLGRERLATLTVPRTGHGVHLERPMTVARAIARWE